MVNVSITRKGKRTWITKSNRDKATAMIGNMAAIREHVPSLAAQADIVAEGLQAILDHFAAKERERAATPLLREDAA